MKLEIKRQKVVTFEPNEAQAIADWMHEAKQGCKMPAEVVALEKFLQEF